MQHIIVAVAQADYAVVEVNDDVLVQLCLQSHQQIHVRNPLAEQVAGLAVHPHDGQVLTLFPPLDVVAVEGVGVAAGLAAESAELAHASLLSHQPHRTRARSRVSPAVRLASTAREPTAQDTVHLLDEVLDEGGDRQGVQQPDGARARQDDLLVAQRLAQDAPMGAIHIQPPSCDVRGFAPCQPVGWAGAPWM